MLRRIAQIKFKLMRVNPYVQLGNTALLVFLAGWQDWFILAGVGVIAAYLFEKYFGLKGEMDLTWRNSDEWQRFINTEWIPFRVKWESRQKEPDTFFWEWDIIRDMHLHQPKPEEQIIVFREALRKVSEGEKK